ncbi:MAG TPA: hypothetical protein VHE12_11145 [bacterium]|nr:hypothetical protein [bacterium]
MTPTPRPIFAYALLAALTTASGWTAPALPQEGPRLKPMPTQSRLKPKHRDDRLKPKHENDRLKPKHPNDKLKPKHPNDRLKPKHTPLPGMTKHEFQSKAEDLKGKKNSQDGLDDQQMGQLQKNMDQKSKTEQEISNTMKKEDDSGSGISKNLK